MLALTTLALFPNLGRQHFYFCGRDSHTHQLKYKYYILMSVIVYLQMLLS